MVYIYSLTPVYDIWNKTFNNSIHIVFSICIYTVIKHVSSYPKNPLIMWMIIIIIMEQVLRIEAYLHFILDIFIDKNSV